jgi:hypothetical protein
MNKLSGEGKTLNHTITVCTTDDGLIENERLMDY